MTKPPTIDEIRQAAAQTSGGQAPTIQPPPGGIVTPDGTPVQPQPPSGVGAGLAHNREVSGLRPETVEGIAGIHEQQKMAARAAAEKQAAEERMQRELEEAKAAEDAARQAQIGGEFQWDALKSALEDNPLLRPGVREHIESQVSSIPNNEVKIADILLGRARQIVPVTDDLNVVYQTIKGHEDLLIKRMLREDYDQLDMYFNTKRDLLSLAISLSSINGREMPGLEGPDGRATEETLKQRMDAVLDLPLPLLASLAVNYTWFDLRVKRKMAPSVLKNG